MRDPSKTIRETLYFAYTDVQRGVKNRTHKLIEYAIEGHERQTQLFELLADPWEMTNLANDPTHAETLSGLRQEMVRLRDDWDDLSSEWGQRFWSRLAGESWAG